MTFPEAFKFSENSHNYDTAHRMFGNFIKDALY